jgi:peptide/nickel transport system ATP-binding protein
MDNTIVRAQDLKKYFHTKQGVVRAADGVSFNIHEQETFGLVGESGSGKSTVAYTIMGIYPATSGELLYRNQDITTETKKRSKSLKREIQIVFQDPGSSLNPRSTIKQILELPLRVHDQASKKERVYRIAKLLEMVELPADFMYKSPPAIGGGERQMIAIARALATNPSFIVLDEPTSALDVSVQAKIINKLMELQKELNLTYMFITHDLSLMRNMSSRVAIMYLGKICEIAPTTEFFSNPLHPYTQMLLSSIPVVSTQEEELKPKKIVSTGEIPSPVDIPPGCSFHLRCPARMDICSKTDPGMVTPEKEHQVRCHLFPGASGS